MRHQHIILFVASLFCAFCACVAAFALGTYLAGVYRYSMPHQHDLAAALALACAIALALMLASYCEANRLLRTYRASPAARRARLLADRLQRGRYHSRAR